MIKTLATVKNIMNKVLSAVCSVLLSFMTILVLWQVFTRYVLNSPAAFTEELVKYSLAGLIFVAFFALFFFGLDALFALVKDLIK